jgi:endogenous inhibitor of DNA gyrase (YacG/DUF329 family)
MRILFRRKCTQCTKFIAERNQSTTYPNAF